MILNVTPSTKTSRAVTKLRQSLTVASVLLQCVVISPAVYAQGPDQDSLLPPEVVPLDPAAAGRMAPSQMPSQMYQSQPQYQMPGQTAGMNYGSQYTPGLADGSPAAMQSAQDFRKAAFNSLMGQTPVQPQVNPNLNMMQGQMGQMPANSSLPAGQQNPFQTFGQPMVANQPVSTQSQTLSGGVKSPNVGKPSQLNGIKHTLGLASSFGGGIMTGVSSPGGLYSLGLMGVGLTNYGLSNSFTRY